MDTSGKAKQYMHAEYAQHASSVPAALLLVPGLALAVYSNSSDTAVMAQSSRVAVERKRRAESGKEKAALFMYIFAFVFVRGWIKESGWREKANGVVIVFRLQSPR